MSALSEKGTDTPLDTAIQCAHFADRIENTVFELHGRAIHVIDRFMDTGSDVTVLAVEIANPRVKILPGLVVSAFPFLNPMLRLVKNDVNPIGDNSRLALDKVARIFKIVRQLIGMGDRMADLPPRFAPEQVPDCTTNR